MNAIKNFYAKLPTWLKPNQEQITAGKVVIKAFFKGVVIAGAGLLVKKLGGSNEMALAVAAIVHPILKWLDPNDVQLGINSTN